jgi:amino acid transporter
MQNSSSIALLGVVFGAVFLLVAIASILSKVTLSLFNPWLGRQIRYRDHPRTFIALVFFYWLFGAAAVVMAIVSVLSGR